MKRSRLILHLGLHKTASTYLQYQFFPRLEDVLYIHGGDFFRTWQRYQSCGSTKAMLVSYEGFSGIAWNDSWLGGQVNDYGWLQSFKANVDSLKQYFPNATVVVLFRRHGDLLISMFKQYIQEGGVLPLDRFFGSEGIIKPHDLMFKTRIEYLQNAFQDCYILNFEEYRRYGDRYLEHFFLHELGISLSESWTKSARTSNYSITGKKVEYLRWINTYYRRVPRKVRSFLRLIGWSPRDIFQHRLGFWQPHDSKELITLRDKINDDFSSDWSDLTLHQWKPDPTFFR